MKTGDFISIRNSETEKMILSEIEGCRYPKEITEKMISIFQEFKTEKTINLSRRYFNEKEVFEVNLDFEKEDKKWFSVFRIIRVGNESQAGSFQAFVDKFKDASPSEKENMLEGVGSKIDAGEDPSLEAGNSVSMNTYKTLTSMKSKMLDMGGEASDDKNPKKKSGMSKISLAANKVLNKIRKTNRFLTLFKRSSIEPVKNQKDNQESLLIENPKSLINASKGSGIIEMPKPNQPKRVRASGSKEKEPRVGDWELLRDGDIVIFQHLVSGNYLKERDTLNRSLALINQNELSSLVFFKLEKLFDPRDTSQLIQEKSNLKVINWQSRNCLSLIEEDPVKISNLRLFAEKFANGDDGGSASLSITKNLRTKDVKHRLEMLQNDFKVKINRFFFVKVESEFLRPLIVMHNFRKTSIHCYDSFFQWGMTLKRAHNEGGPSSENIFDKQTALSGHHQILETQKQFDASLKDFSDLIVNIQDFKKFSLKEGGKPENEEVSLKRGEFQRRLEKNKALLGYLEKKLIDSGSDDGKNPQVRSDGRARTQSSKDSSASGLDIFGDSEVILRNKTFMQQMMRKNGVIEVLVGFIRLFCQKIYKSIDFESIYGAEQENLRRHVTNFASSQRLRRYFFYKKDFSWESLKYTPQKMGFEIFGNIFTNLLSIVNFFIR